MNGTAPKPGFRIKIEDIVVQVFAVALGVVIGFAVASWARAFISENFSTVP